MIAYKGFNDKLQCTPKNDITFQYEVGKEYKEEKANLCSAGFHACERPLDVLLHYHPRDKARYAIVELGEVTEQKDSDSKRAGKSIKIVSEISLTDLIKAQFEYVKSNTTTEHTDPKAATAGEYGAATAGYNGAATAGYNGAATAGNSGYALSGGTASVGNDGVAVSKNITPRVKGGIGATLILIKTDDYDKVIKKKIIEVDGEKIKPNTWYTIEANKVVECADR